MHFSVSMSVLIPFMSIHFPISLITKLVITNRHFGFHQFTPLLYTFRLPIRQSQSNSIFSKFYYHPTIYLYFTYIFQLRSKLCNSCVISVLKSVNTSHPATCKIEAFDINHVSRKLIILLKHFLSDHPVPIVFPDSLNITFP